MKLFAISLLTCMTPFMFGVELLEISESRKYLTETDLDHYNDWTFNVFGAMGLRSLEGDEFAPVNKQSNMGILFDFGREEWPVHFCIDYFTSSDSGTEANIDYEATNTELDIGIRYVIDIPDSHITLQTGFGISFVDVEVSTDTGLISTTDSADGHGFWLQMGAYYRFQNRFLVGFDIRYGDASIEINPGNSVNGAAWQTNFIIGVRF